MLTLSFGLIIFIAIHLVKVVGVEFRAGLIERVGLTGWRLIHGIFALAGLLLIVSGYAEARMDPVWIWFPPAFLSHLTGLLMLIAFIFVAAALVPGNPIKARVGYPLLIGVKTWAIAHLLVNGALADLLLFGAMLLWAAVSFSLHRRQDRATGNRMAVNTTKLSTLFTLILALVMTAVFALWLHPALIGVPAVIRS